MISVLRAVRLGDLLHTSTGQPDLPAASSFHSSAPATAHAYAPSHGPRPDHGPPALHVLDAERDWSQLTPGEKQRLDFARLLLRLGPPPGCPTPGCPTPGSAHGGLGACVGAGMGTGLDAGAGKGIGAGVGMDAGVALCVLDEATSAVDAPEEAALYSLLLRRAGPGTAVISFGHRDSLRAYHTHLLELSGAGAWRLSELRGEG